MPTDDSRRFESARAQEFAALETSAYLNAASVGPLPDRAIRAIGDADRRRAAAQLLADADFSEPLTRCRQAAARMIGAHEDEIALGGNTSFGINLAAFGLPLAPGSRVLLSAGEFPANVYPWMAQQGRGVEIELVPLDARGLPDEPRILERLGRGDVSALAISSVGFAHGFRADLEAMAEGCRACGAFLVVDAIQSLGSVPIDVQRLRIDVLATGGHKWLCGPFGTGFAYVRRDLHERLAAPGVGWTSMESSRDFARLTDYRWEWVPGARRFEVATPPFAGLLGLAHAMELLMELGVERIERHVRALQDRALGEIEAIGSVEVASSLEPERRSAILAFRTSDPDRTVRALGSRGVICAVREGMVRISPHFYNTQEDMDRMIAILARQERN
jgi:cysteine desulfurase / selenocysteine lyase